MKITFIKRLICIGLLNISLLGFSSVGASAEWRQNSDKTWNYYNNGNLLKNTWFYDKSNSKWYYFDNNGIMAKNTIIQGKYQVGDDGSLVKNDTNNNIAVNNTLPISIPSNWNSLGGNRYSINNRSVVTYSVSDMTGWTQESVMNDLRKITYEQGNYDSNVELQTYNGNNAYAYSYTTLTKEYFRKVLYITLFKNNKHYDFILISDYGNYNEDRKELENVLNATLNI